MFTGIIDHIGEITRTDTTKAGISAWVRCDFTDIQEGESISVDGMCLTALNPEANAFRCDISPETLKLTTAKDFKAGRKVNLERAMRASDRFGGHVVTGHIDTHCQLLEKKAEGEFYHYRFGNLTPEFLRYLTKKGSVAINGVSLTINNVHNDGFDVMLIPHTLERTTLDALEKNDDVNIEVDTFARIIIDKTLGEHS